MNTSVSRNFLTGTVASIGVVTPLQINVGSGIISRHGVLLKADSGNAGAVFIGNSGVTAFVSPTTDGYPLRPGEFQTFPIDNSAGIYMISNQGSNRIWWFIA